MTKHIPTELHHYCGIAGGYAQGGINVVNSVIEMGKALQHRGQNGGGVAVKPQGKILKVYKKARAFNEIFSSVDVIEDHSLRGEIAIAHLRYPTEGASRQNCDAQPFYASYKGWELALGHNGNVVDIKRHFNKLKKLGVETESDSDSEILTWLIVTAPGSTWKQKITNALSDVKGAYSLVMVTGDDKLMALRDPWGVRPLVWTQDNGHVFVASETCALDRINIRHSQRIEPGQLLIADKNGVSQTNYTPVKKHAFCVFEKLYFGGYLNDADKKYLSDLMVHTSFEDRISAYLREDLIFSHKIGSWPDSWHDCGVVYTETKESELIVCLMSQRAPYENFLNAAKMTGEFVNILMN